VENNESFFNYRTRSVNCQLYQAFIRTTDVRKLSKQVFKNNLYFHIFITIHHGD